MSCDRLGGNKTWTVWEVSDILERDGERDGGHIPAWSASPGSVETLAARRWVPLQCLCAGKCSSAPVAQV